ncbi:YcxB family protein [Flavobacterium sp. 2]|uniref:YcxB family protein n=1 Tax=Flavobacterium sp. 2 TaxID=308053 RepID=UPI003CF0FE03
MDKEIILKPSFNVSSSMKGTYYILYKPLHIFIFFFLLAAAIFSLSDYFFNILDNKDETKHDFPFFALIIILIPFFIYLLTYKAVKKEINHNPRIKEDIKYIFNIEYFQEKGETFEVKHFWKNIVKIVEKKDMFLFYLNKNRAILLQKTDLKGNQYDELKQLFNSINIKKSLKS